jgi:hypothetical protein
MIPTHVDETMYHRLYIEVVLGLNKIIYQYDTAGSLGKKRRLPRCSAKFNATIYRSLLCMGVRGCVHTCVYK